MSRHDEKDTGAKEIVSRAEENGEVAMSATATSRGDGAGVSKQLALQYLQRGIRRLAVDWCQRFARKREFWNGHGETRGLSHHRESRPWILV